MLNKFAALRVLGTITLIRPIHALARQALERRPCSFIHGHWQGSRHGSHCLWSGALIMLNVVGVIVFFIRRSRSEHRRHWSLAWRMMDSPSQLAPHRPLQTLKERTIRGDIEMDEHKEKKAAVLSNPSH